jgi:hypothetical protein
MFVTAFDRFLVVKRHVFVVLVIVVVLCENCISFEVIQLIDVIHLGNLGWIEY